MNHRFWFPMIRAALIATLVVLVGVGAAAAPDLDAGADGFLPDGADEGASDADLEAETPTLEERATRLQQQLEALQLALTGELSEGFALQELAGVDLSNEAAVTAHKKALKAQIVELEAQVAALRPDAAAPVEDAGKEHKGKDRGKGKDAGVEDADMDAGADVTEVADGGPAPVTELSVTELELGVARARLDLASKPLDVLKKLASEDAERQKIEREKREAAEAQNEALKEQRSAEEAQRRALEEADRARNEIQRVVANETARVEGVRASQAAYKRKLAEQSAGFVTKSAAMTDRLLDLVKAANSAQPFSSQADATYDKVITALVEVRGLLQNALDAYSGVPDVPRYEPTAAYSDVKAQLAPKDAERLAKQAAELEAARADLEKEAGQLAWDNLTKWIHQEKTLNDARLSLLQRLTPDKRSRVLGFGSEGIAQLRREIHHVVLQARWYRVNAEARLISLVGKRGDPGAWFTLLKAIVLLGLVLAVAVYVRRKGRPLLERARGVVVRVLRRPRIVRPLIGSLFMVDAVLPELVFFLVLIAIRWALGPSAQVPELAIPLQIVIWFAMYRLAVAATHRAIAWLASPETGIKGVKEETSQKILRSVRLIARYVFLVAITLVVATQILGEGYLYTLVRNFFWLGAIPIFLVLIRWWRASITTAYLGYRSQGKLADAVRSTQERWYGFFVALAAFGVVAVRSGLNAARRFVTGFDQTRKALAFLFRRRLEKQAATASIAPSEAELPEDLTRYFSEEPVEGGPRTVENFPGLKGFQKYVEDWQKGGRTGATLVVGEPGFGKTSWINVALTRIGDLEVVRVPLDTRLLTAEKLVRRMTKALDVQATDVEGLVTAIVKRDRCMVVLDDAHRLFQRGVGKMEAWEALSALVERVNDRVFWLASMDSFSYAHLKWRHHGSVGFRKTIELLGWNEAGIEQLLLNRQNRSGYNAVYDDLVVDRLEGVEAEAQVINTQQGYMRLVWDYADGCPRVALRCWRYSLVPDTDMKVRVRLFRRPDTDHLDALSEMEKFVLASVVWHGDVTSAEAALALNLPVSDCEDDLEKLTEVGILAVRNRRYSVTSTWSRAVIRYVRRQHLI